MVTGRLYTSTNILVTPCSFVCNRDRLSKNAREKIADLASQLLAMPEKGNLLARLGATAEAQEALVLTPGYSAHMRNVAYVQSFAKGATAADHVETNPAVGVALQTLKEAHPDVDQALQKIQKSHSVTKGLVDSYCRKQISKLLKQAAAKKEAAKEAAEATAKERAAKEAAPQGHEPKGGDKNKRKRTKGSDEDEVVEDSLQAELDNLNVGIKAVALDVGWREIRKVLDDKASDAPHGGKEANWAKQWGTASEYTKDHVCELLAKGDKVLLHHMAQVRKKQKPHFLLLHGSEVFDPPANGTCMFACFVRLIQASGKVGLLKHMGVTKHLPQGTIPTQPDHVMAKLMKVAQPLIVRFEKSMSKGKARRYFEGGAEALSEESSISSQGGSKRRSSRNKDSDSQGQVNSGLDIQIQKLMHGHIDHLACCDGEWLQDCMGCNRFHSSGLGDWKGNAALGEWEDNAFGGADELADETQHCALGGAAALAALANKANKANKAAAVRRLVREVLSGTSLGDLTTHIVRQRVEAYMGRQVEEYNALISQEMCCYMLEHGVEHAVEVPSEQQQQLAKQTAPEQQIEAAAPKKKVRKKLRRPRTNKPIKSAKSAPAPNARSSTPGAGGQAKKKKQKGQAKKKKQKVSKTDKRTEALAALDLTIAPKSKQEVEAAYRQAARQHHPDRRRCNCTSEQTEHHSRAYAALEPAKAYLLNTFK